jgi:alkylhydroperoxidase family enzyme
MSATPPRIPYVPADLAEPAEVVAAIRARRGGELIALDRMLLHSPPLAAGWNTFLGAVRTGLTVDRRLRELAMCVVAVINGAEYEYTQHAPLYLAAGASAAQAQALRDPDAALANVALFDARERAALAVAIEMTRHVKVADASFAELRRHLDERQTVEFVAVVAAYNMVSRFLVATGIHPD